jgi:hypothetical protein
LSALKGCGGVARLEELDKIRRIASTQKFPVKFPVRKAKLREIWA